LLLAGQTDGRTERTILPLLPLPAAATKTTTWTTATAVAIEMAATT
jgi:hypothetical protein